MAAGDEADLVHMVATQVAINDRPSALRYPRGEGVGTEMPAEGKPLEIGKGRISAKAPRSLCFRSAPACPNASRPPRSWPPSACPPPWRMPASPSRSTPIWFSDFANEHEVLITVEEGAIGGFAAQVYQTLSDHGALDRGLKVRSMILPDIFIDQDLPAAMYAKAELDTRGIVKKVFEALGKDVGVGTVKLA